ncbi:MAG TPA: hypothetical protein VMW69_03455 [Spirochaetia bacterium]|nr:hypothetical protein [Spirochaetia bacterium]
MKSRVSFYCAGPCVGILLLAVFSCQQAVDLPPTATSATMTLSIVDGLSAYALSAATLATELDSISLTVTGEGMDTITQTIDPGTSQVALEVPEGPARNFRIDVAVKPTSPHAVSAIRGTAIADIQAGVAQTVPISFAITKAKILVPDMVNGKVVMMADLNGAGLQVKNLGDEGISPALPYDVEIDSAGRIYVCTYDTDNQQGDIFRYDSMIDTTPEDVLGTNFNHSMDTPAIAIDRTNNYLYHVKNITVGPTYWALYRKSLVNPLANDEVIISESDPELKFTEGTCGVAIDADGFVYIYNNGDQNLIKFDPNGTVGSRGIASVSYTALGLSSARLWDLMFLDGNLYVSLSYGMQALQTEILRLGTGLSVDSVLHYGSYSADPGVGQFAFPERFASDLTGRVVLVDENPNNSSVNRLVGFDDINGTNWQEYSGSYPFQFFSN